MDIVLSLGSNSGNREEHIEEAVVILKSLLDSVRVSDVYETQALDGESAPYINAVMKGTTNLRLEDFIKVTKEIEKILGRRRIPGEDVVAIDIDVVIADGVNLRPKDYEQSYFQIGYKSL